MGSTKVSTPLLIALIVLIVLTGVFIALLFSLVSGPRSPLSSISHPVQTLLSVMGSQGPA